MANIDNYRPISLLPHLHKLLIDLYYRQSYASFRKGFSTTKHLSHTTRTMKKLQNIKYLTLVD